MLFLIRIVILLQARQRVYLKSFTKLIKAPSLLTELFNKKLVLVVFAKGRVSKNLKINLGGGKMKRIGNIFKDVVSIENILHAHKNARKDKSFYTDVQMVDSDPEFYAKEIQKRLLGNEYQVSAYTIFERQCGEKLRKIYKLPYFPDRIVQWAIMLQIQNRLDKHFIAHTYSAIPGRGIHLAVRNVNKELKHDPQGTRYCLKLDVNKYYPSIDQDRLMEKLCRVIKCSETLSLIKKIVSSLPKASGIPIGSYLSQYFGNYYLSDLDHYCKEKLVCKYYHRYMDDIVIFGDSKEYLWKVFYAIKAHLSTDGLTIKSNYKIFPIDSEGLDFVGYRFFRNRTIARKRIYKKLRKRMSFLSKVKRTKNQECSYQSYNGWLKWTTCSKLKRRLENEI